MTEYMQAFILTFIEAVCCTMFFGTFFEKRFIEEHRRAFTWVNKGLLGGICLLFMGISILCGENYIIKAIVVMITICVIMLCMYRGKVLQVLFLSVVYYGFVLLLDRVIFIFVLYAMNVREETFWSNPIRATMISLLAKNVLFLCIFCLKRKLKVIGDFSAISDKEWICFLFFPLISIICMTAFAVERREMGKEVLVVSFGLMFLNFLVFFIIQDIIRHEREKQEIQLLHERTKNQVVMYEYMEGVYDEQRKQLHDFKNHMSCVQGLLKNHAYEEANDYLRNMNENWIDEIDYINTNHVIANSVLNQKYKQARKKGIAMILSVNDLQGIPLKDEDIVTLLANLLDNAIEACEKATKQAKMIHVRFWYENHNIYISTKNPVEQPLSIHNGKIQTTKADKKKHGIGLTNIRSVVEKYGGEDICSYQDGYFTHSIVIEKNDICMS